MTWVRDGQVQARVRFASTCPTCGSPCDWESVGRAREGASRMQSQSHPLVCLTRHLKDQP